MTPVPLVANLNVRSFLILRALMVGVLHVPLGKDGGVGPKTVQVVGVMLLLLLILLLVLLVMLGRVVLLEVALEVREHWSLYLLALLLLLMLMLAEAEKFKPPLVLLLLLLLLLPRQRGNDRHVGRLAETCTEDVPLLPSTSLVLQVLLPPLCVIQRVLLLLLLRVVIVLPVSLSDDGVKDKRLHNNERKNTTLV